ncbi:MAG: 4,5-dihydroxyphthalate decarboxylase [Proteobacteria bacterium]|nr:4,5-dihydroxyphthalate decarboxylase [Pseudomonadota bacterium]
MTAETPAALSAAGRLMLTIAISDYDHVRDFASGRVRAEGIDTTFLTLTIEEIFFRFVKFREWAVSEMSMGKYVALRSQGDTSLTAIPVFPSRVFRHSSIYVRRDGAVRAPADLKGRKIGVPEWAQTAAVYSRGALIHQYGLKLQDIDWYQAGVNEPGRTEKVKLNLPAGTRYTAVPGKSLDAMLLAGELDAILTAHPPASFERGDPKIVRLFEDYRAVEEAYWRDTGIFPIMHVVAIRSDVLAPHPWIAVNLFNAFEEAKRRSVARALEVTATRFPVPWIYDLAAKAQAQFGELFPYGVEPNRPTLEAFLQYAFEQGVCHRRLAVDELFADALASRFKV